MKLLVYIIIIFFLLLNLGVWEFVIFFYGVILRFWRFSLRHISQKSYRLSINYGNFLYFPQIIRKCMFVSHISSYFSFKLLLVSHSTMLNRFKLIGTLNHIDIEFYVAKIAIFSIFCCFLSLFWPKNLFLLVLFAIMKFHATSQLKNSTGMTFRQTNMAESTVNTQARPLQKLFHKLFIFTLTALHVISWA